MVIEFNPLYEISRDMDRVFDTFFAPTALSRRKRAYPPLNLSEDADTLFVECELPGVKIEDIDITLTDSTLTIKGELNPEDGKHFRSERASGPFQRVVNLYSEVERDNISATLKDGILEIALPKAEEVKPKKIAIEAS